MADTAGKPCPELCARRHVAERAARRSCCCRKRPPPIPLRGSLNSEQMFHMEPLAMSNSDQTSLRAAGDSWEQFIKTVKAFTGPER